MFFYTIIDSVDADQISKDKRDKEQSGWKIELRPSSGLVDVFGKSIWCNYGDLKNLPENVLPSLLNITRQNASGYLIQIALKDLDNVYVGELSKSSPNKNKFMPYYLYEESLGRNGYEEPIFLIKENVTLEEITLIARVDVYKNFYPLPERFGFAEEKIDSIVSWIIKQMMK